MNIEAFFRWSFGLGFDIYRTDAEDGGTVLAIDIYLGPLTIEVDIG